MVDLLRHLARCRYGSVAFVVSLRFVAMAGNASAGQADASIYGLVTDESGGVFRRHYACAIRESDRGRDAAEDLHQR